MDNYDDDFGTLREPPQPVKQARTLEDWKDDDFDLNGASMGTLKLRDWDATIKRGSPAPASFGMEPDAFDDDFADDFDVLRPPKRPQQQQQVRADAVPDLFLSSLSDSSNMSPGRMSVSSSASSLSTVPAAWDNDEDFESLDPQLDLAARFESHKRRVAEEAAREAAQNQQRSPRKRGSALAVRFHDLVEDMDDQTGVEGLDIDSLRLSRNTVNKNVKFGAPRIPSWLQQSPISKSKTQSSVQHSRQHQQVLRNSRSIAQLGPLAQIPSMAPPSGSKLRAAQSMMDFGRRSQQHSQPQLQPQQQPQLQPQSQSPQRQSPTRPLSRPKSQEIRQRPLTYYKEPILPPKEHDHQTGRHKRRNKGPSLIRNNKDTLTSQERNGMVLNPITGMWEGNDSDALRFDTSLEAVQPAPTTSGLRPRLIQQPPSLKDLAGVGSDSGMVFDSQNLCWKYVDQDDYEDPFAGLDEPNVAEEVPGSPRRSVTGTSTTSFGSSISRPEHSGREVFDVPAEIRIAWKREDERIMRKFGRWIGGAKERADSKSDANCLYQMFRNP